MAEKRVTNQQKKLIEERAGGCREYCRSPQRVSPASFAVEHIIPRSGGGVSTIQNLALSCQGCNNSKYTKIEARDPVSGEMVPLYNPRKHRWLEHFNWSQDFMLIIGLTASGRATVEALHLNRAEVRNLRRLLLAAGEHPPSEPEN